MKSMNGMPGNALRVGGNAEVGHFVVYYDVANQGGEVFVVTGKHVNAYSLRSTEDGHATSSDLRQHGWAFA